MLEDINRFLTYIELQKGLSQHTIDSYNKDLTKFAEYLTAEKLSLEGLMRHQFRGFLAELNNQKLNNSSINRILSAIKGFIKYKIRYKYVDSAGILDVDSRKISRYLPSFLFEDEIEELVSINGEKKRRF